MIQEIFTGAFRLFVVLKIPDVLILLVLWVSEVAAVVVVVFLFFFLAGRRRIALSNLRILGKNHNSYLYIVIILGRYIVMINVRVDRCKLYCYYY